MFMEVHVDSERRTLPSLNPAMVFRRSKPNDKKPIAYVRIKTICIEHNIQEKLMKYCRRGKVPNEISVNL